MWFDFSFHVRSLLARGPHSRSFPWIAAARATAGASAMPRARLPGRLLVCLPVGACAAAEMARRAVRAASAQSRLSRWKRRQNAVPLQSPYSPPTVTPTVPVGKNRSPLTFIRFRGGMEDTIFLAEDQEVWGLWFFPMGTVGVTVGGL